jgi:hypothetical protein
MIAPIKQREFALNKSIKATGDRPCLFAESVSPRLISDVPAALRASGTAREMNKLKLFATIAYE